MAPKISVIMSVYDGERHLGESVESVLNQIFSDFEFSVDDFAVFDIFVGDDLGIF